MSLNTSDNPAFQYSIVHIPYKEILFQPKIRQFIIPLVPDNPACSR